MCVYHCLGICVLMLCECVLFVCVGNYDMYLYVYICIFVCVRGACVWCTVGMYVCITCIMCIIVCMWMYVLCAGVYKGVCVYKNGYVWYLSNVLNVYMCACVGMYI